MTRTFLLLVLLLASVSLGQAPPQSPGPAESPGPEGASPPPPTPVTPIHGRLTLSNGDAHPGEFLPEEIRLATEYAELVTINPAFLRSLRLGAPAQATLVNGDVISGTLQNRTLTFQTFFGTRTVPVENITSLATDLPAVQRRQGTLLITLRSGDRVSGTVLAEDSTPLVPGSIPFRVPFGAVYVRPETIERIRPTTGGTIEIVTVDGSVATVAAGIPAVRLSTIYAGVLTLAGDQIDTILLASATEAPR
ncbi:MAG: hypothetical protein HY335_02100 [Deinococcus sp.]|nr:hypothetical protein [Deinococcus sp.]